MIFQLLNPAIEAKDHLSVNQNERQEFTKFKNQNWSFCKILMINLLIVYNMLFRRYIIGQTNLLYLDKK